MAVVGQTAQVPRDDFVFRSLEGKERSDESARYVES